MKAAVICSLLLLGLAGLPVLWALLHAFPAAVVALLLLLLGILARLRVI